MREEQMNANRVRLRLMETEAYCRELEGKNKTLHEQLEIESAARKSAERRICVCIAVVPLCSSPLTNTADIPIGILSFFRHKYENSFFGIGNNKKSPPLFLISTLFSFLIL